MPESCGATTKTMADDINWLPWKLPLRALQHRLEIQYADPTTRL